MDFCEKQKSLAKKLVFFVCVRGCTILFYGLITMKIPIKYWTAKNLCEIKNRKTCLLLVQNENQNRLEIDAKSERALEKLTRVPIWYSSLELFEPQDMRS